MKKNIEPETSLENDAHREILLFLKCRATPSTLRGLHAVRFGKALLNQRNRLSRFGNPEPVSLRRGFVMLWDLPFVVSGSVGLAASSSLSVCGSLSWLCLLVSYPTFLSLALSLSLASHSNSLSLLISVSLSASLSFSV